jgi:hypothetical protein
MAGAVYFLKFSLQAVADFFRHWYVGGAVAWIGGTIGFLERLDRRLALRVSLRYLFSPLFQQRDLIGFTLGFIFRLLRILVALVVYGAAIFFSFLLFLGWAILPAVLIYKIFRT